MPRRPPLIDFASDRMPFAISATPAPPPAPVHPKRSRYCALTPYMDHIERECNAQLDKLAAAGVDVFKHGGCSEISYARSQMLSLAMSDGYEAAIFIDSDIIFNVNEALHILARPEPVVAGIYSQKILGKFNVNFIDGETPVVFGKGGGDRLARHVGAGFLRITAGACQTIIEKHDLPCCTAGPGSAAIWPFFLPMVKQAEGEDGTVEWRYMGEDFAFCERAWEAGIEIIADTRIRLFHLGKFPYGWEQAARIGTERVDSVTVDP